MKRAYRKRSYRLGEIRRFLEPGPIVLVSSAWQGNFNIMTMGWHMMLGFSPALFGCYIWEENHSYQMLRRSKECVINLPTLDLVETVVGIGNCHGTDIDKFERFGLTPKRATKVAAPLIAECYANFECRLRDTRMIRTHGLFIWEVVKAHVQCRLGDPRRSTTAVTVSSWFREPQSTAAGTSGRRIFELPHGGIQPNVTNPVIESTALSFRLG